ncbi:unnamed protein product, partial [Strongylus vulgaris]
AHGSGYGIGTSVASAASQREAAGLLDKVLAPAPILPRFSSPVATSTPNSDYHSRTTPVFKSYKFAQKLSQRPRLRIRRPGEKAIAENSIQEDPNLTPFQNSARNRFGYARTIKPPSTTEPVTTTTTEATTTTSVMTTPELETTDASEDESGDSGRLTC